MLICIQLIMKCSRKGMENSRIGLMIDSFDSIDWKRLLPIENGNCIIQEGVTSNGKCFYECTSLTSVESGSSLINIGDYAFISSAVQNTLPLIQAEVPKKCKIIKHSFDKHCYS